MKFIRDQLMIHHQKEYVGINLQQEIDEIIIQQAIDKIEMELEGV